MYRYNAHFIPKNGHLGCAKSHLGVIDYAEKQKFDEVLILEDDFSFDLDEESVCNFFNKIKSVTSWDVIMLTHVNGKEYDCEYDFLKRVNKANTSSGYLVNKNYYQKLKNIFIESCNNMNELNTSQKGFEPQAIDQKWTKLQEKDFWFVANPHVGSQNQNLISTIQKYTNYNI